MKPRFLRCVLSAALALGAGGCQEAPAVAYVTDRLEIAPDFDYPVCEGTLQRLDKHVTFVEDELAQWIPPGERIRFYWLTDGVGGWCSDGATGCYYPGTRIVIGDSSTVTHEIVHSVLDAEAQTNLFLEEALAELFSGVGAYHRPGRGNRPAPSELLWLSPADYRQGDLDYVVASHFMSYLYRAHGKAPIRGLASSVVSGASPSELEVEFDAEFDGPFPEIEANYMAKAYHYYRGLRDPLVPAAQLGAGPVELELDCDGSHTYGPRWDGEPGMYRVFSTWVPQPTRFALKLHGEDPLELQIVSLKQQRDLGHVVDWNNPGTIEGIDLPHLVGGEETVVNLHAGTHLLVFSTPGYEGTLATLESQVLELGGRFAP